jgi:serine/threonine protein kinase
MKLWRRNNPNDLKLLEPLGEGLTSQVYKAIRKHDHLGVEQVVAVKVLNSTKAVQALKNEIHVLTQIESLHCVRLLGWADLKRGPALVLEYLDGVSLQDLCAYESISPVVADEIVAQLQMGLRDLHAHGIGHGDLSAKNIFITNRGVVKILDFGFSGGGGGDDLFGTPQFIAIEAWRGDKLTIHSDLFSLGLLREDLLAGTVLQHGTREGWRRRATAVCGRNLLLQEIPGAREFLPVQSAKVSKDRLTELVKQVQNKKRAMKNTTRIVSAAKRMAAVPKQLGAPRWLPALSFCSVFLFFVNLQPANMGLAPLPPARRDLSLDVRSRDWALVKLFQKNETGWRERGRPVYAPVKFRKLQTGNYELHWKSRGRTGIIFVQLTESRRILIR